MKPLQFTGAQELVIVPSAGSSKNDFDFFIGKWLVKNRKLKTRLNAAKEWTEFEATIEDHMILNGLGNMDHFKTFFNDSPFEALTLRLFNPVTRLWSIYWADNNSGTLDVPQVGSFENSIGHFYSKDIFQGKEIIVAFKWDKTNPVNPGWSQAFSPDNGKTWEWNWYMDMQRVE